MLGLMNDLNEVLGEDDLNVHKNNYQTDNLILTIAALLIAVLK